MILYSFNTRFQKLLKHSGYNLFDQQNKAYTQSVLPAECGCRLAIEAGVTECWWRYVGSFGAVLGMDRFGLSAPAEELFEYFGFKFFSA